MPSGATGVCGSSPSTLATASVLSSARAVPSSSDRARPRLEQPGQAAQQGGLAAGVGADDRGHLAVEQRDVEVADDRRAVVAEGQPLGAQSAHPPPPCRLVVMSSQSRYGAPTAPVTTPVGSGVGSSWAATRSAASSSAAPTRAAASDAAGGRTEQPVGDRSGDQRDERDRPGHRHRQRDERDRGGEQPGPAQLGTRAEPAGGVVAELEYAQLALAAARPSTSRTGTVANRTRSSLGVGLADRAGQPVHRLPSLEDLGPAQHVADQPLEERRDADADQDEAVARHPVRARPGRTSAGCRRPRRRGPARRAPARRPGAGRCRRPRPAPRRRRPRRSPARRAGCAAAAGRWCRTRRGPARPPAPTGRWAAAARGPRSRRSGRRAAANTEPITSPAVSRKLPSIMVSTNSAATAASRPTVTAVARPARRARTAAERVGGRRRSGAATGGGSVAVATVRPPTAGRSGRSRRRPARRAPRAPRPPAARRGRPPPGRGCRRAAAVSAPAACCTG